MSINLYFPLHHCSVMSYRAIMTFTTNHLVDKSKPMTPMTQDAADSINKKHNQMKWKDKNNIYRKKGHTHTLVFLHVHCTWLPIQKIYAIVNSIAYLGKNLNNNLCIKQYCKFFCECLTWTIIYISHSCEPMKMVNE